MKKRRGVAGRRGGEEVRRLEPVPDLSSESRLPATFPLYRDPLVQLLACCIVFLGALFGSLLASGEISASLQVTAVAAVLLSCIVLLRSVRTGWNVKAYGRARRAIAREATMRIERDALRELPAHLALLVSGEGDPRAGESLQAHVVEIRRALSRRSGRSTIAIVEEVGGRFAVLAVAGYLCERPYHVAPGKSCLADRSFAELLRTFAPLGTTDCERVRHGPHHYWVGAACTTPRAELDPALVRTLAAWVSIAAALDQMPEAVRPVLKVS
jgi:hypothetical protein